MGEPVDIRDFSTRNIGDLKNFKVKTLDHSKSLIESVHSRLRSTRNIQSNLLHLDNITAHLQPRLAKTFEAMPHHCDVLEDLTALQRALLPILDYLVCYKPELGLCLQRQIECYNLLALDQFEGYYKNENHKEVELNKRQAALDKKEVAVEDRKTGLYT